MPGFIPCVRRLSVGLATLCLTSACGVSPTSLSQPKSAQAYHQAEVRGSIINTTYNTYRDQSGQWVSTMGPLSQNRHGGLACDAVSERFRGDDYTTWFVAPSDVAELGLRSCTPNPYGGEPTCQENYAHCGQALRVTCTDQTWCAAASGSPSIYQDMINGKAPVNNYLPEVYSDKLRQRYGNQPPRPRSVVLYVTDFCPKLHSDNQRTGNCSGPQVDISTAAFMLLARRNAQGYINSAINYQVEMLSAVPDQLGPE